MLIDEHSCIGGAGGHGGVGGTGGFGGRGGFGGCSYSWTESIRRYDGTYEYIHRFNPGGLKGLNGADGKNGNGGKNGMNGSSGVYQIKVQNNGSYLTYNEKYFLKVIYFNFINSDDMIYEPGEEVFIYNLQVCNVGNMPTPGCQDIIAILKPYQGLQFHNNDRLIYKREILPNSTLTLQESLRFFINNFNIPSREGIPTTVLNITPLSLVTRINKDFGPSFTRNFK